LVDEITLVHLLHYACKCPTHYIQEKEKIMDLWLALYWGSPIGLGVFFLGLGVLFMGIAQNRK